MEHWSATSEIQEALDAGLGVAVRRHRYHSTGGRFGPGTSATDEIHAILEGDSELYLGGGWQPAGAGTLTFFPRNAVYGVRPAKGHEGDHRILTFLFQGSKQWRCPLAAQPVRLTTPWKRMLLSLEERCDFDRCGQRVIAREELQRFLTNLALAERAGGTAQLHRSGTRAGAGTAESPRRMDTAAGWMAVWAAAEDIIRRRACSGLTVDELAEAVHVSTPTLRRIFIAACGYSPKQALTRFRLEQARQFLATGKWNVTQVAAMVGYTTVQRFSAAFHEATGCTPVAFARRG